jgi:hypothetical protein
MYLANEVSRRLREELRDPRLVVRVNLDLGRWTVCLRRKMLTGSRRYPFRLGDNAELLPGESSLREVATYEEIVYVLEDNGRYLSLDPGLCRRELEKRDGHRRNLVAELQAQVRASRARAEARFADEARQRARYYRKAFARAADEMGLVGRPDYQAIYHPKPVYGV